MRNRSRTLLLSCLGFVAAGWVALPVLARGQRGDAGEWVGAMTMLTLALSVPMLVAALNMSDARRDAAEGGAQRGEGASGERPATTDRICEP